MVREEKRSVVVVRMVVREGMVVVLELRVGFRDREKKFVGDLC